MRQTGEIHSQRLIDVRDPEGRPARVGVGIEEGGRGTIALLQHGVALLNVDAAARYLGMCRTAGRDAQAAS